ncbi:hypothetical protein FHJ30_12275 [Arthrobacter sp. BB-1]|uniref:hypothetical protein n=1 Tax=unclassified Arthrobacter TaxID=235627 RepID=UPI0010DDAE67|nr:MULTISPECIES: hypothetical protein [unclassified Arthrobacter]TNB71475.1 hypothetical protein FHJ30_12275 [Arthrobacter sp. BB-1]VII96756.1 hypothetical protein [Arthrobacter sp. DR-2P]
MKRILATLGVTSLALMGATATAFATGESGGGEKITICHATGSETHPYQPITIDLNALNGHAGAHHQHEEDIIPANNGKVLPRGQNLDKVDVWNAGCAMPGGNPAEPPKDNDKKITICHATGSEKNPYQVITIALQGLNGHGGAHHQHEEDIIPPNSGKVIPAGQNWTAAGQAIFENDCKPVKVTTTPPTTTPPTTPPTVPGAVVPPAGAVPGTNPRGAVAGGGAGAVAEPNEGFNVQTAVSASSGVGTAPWLGGLAAVLAAGVALAVRKAIAGVVVRGQHHG